MEKIKNFLTDLGLKVTYVREVAPFTVDVYFLEGSGDFWTKFFFVGPKGNFISKHNGKVVVPISLVLEGYNSGKLIEKDTYFLFKSLPTIIEIDSNQYLVRYKKDVWGW